MAQINKRGLAANVYLMVSEVGSVKQMKINNARFTNTPGPSGLAALASQIKGCHLCVSSPNRKWHFAQNLSRHDSDY